MNHAKLTVQTAEGDELPVWLAWPEAIPPVGGWPVIYVLDEKEFRLLLQMRREAGAQATPAVLVGIGIPSAERRHYFYTPKIGRVLEQPAGTGGSAVLLQTLVNVVVPEVERWLAVKPLSAATLVGHSLGGLFVAQLLLQEPVRFKRYVISSPSVWWGDFYLLRQAVEWRCRSMETHRPTVHVSVGGLEQGLTPADLALPAEKQQENQQRRERRRMVDGARQFYETLDATGCFELTFNVLEGADHGTASAQAFKVLIAAE
ncbi:alpha/beta hydrolase [Alcaligenaceae bacterium 429]|uniref:alpha/beta hydrolase n=1 Tax=Paenalcaligenes sp. Me52 TaxID=3392038 RepID=UPI0010922B6C|nr:alpha/beta hydrolase [Alcaligenaceae bacterium 429]